MAEKTTADERREHDAVLLNEVRNDFDLMIREMMRDIRADRGVTATATDYARTLLLSMSEALERYGGGRLD